MRMFSPSQEVLSDSAGLEVHLNVELGSKSQAFGAFLCSAVLQRKQCVIYSRCSQTP